MDKKPVTKQTALEAIREAERLLGLYQYDNVLPDDKNKAAATSLNFLTEARVRLCDHG